MNYNVGLVKESISNIVKVKNITVPGWINFNIKEQGWKYRSGSESKGTS